MLVSDTTRVLSDEEVKVLILVLVDVGLGPKAHDVFTAPSKES